MNKRFHNVSSIQMTTISVVFYCNTEEEKIHLPANAKSPALPKQCETPLTIPISYAYASISDTTPAPTVLPPSRIANRNPTSTAIGVISSTSIFTLSPGMHISTPSGN